jgi:hypothetical protein
MWPLGLLFLGHRDTLNFSGIATEVLIFVTAEWPIISLCKEAQNNNHAVVFMFPY